MDAIRKTLAGLCAVLFVITAPAALLLFNLDRRALNANTYKHAFADQGIYDQVPVLVGEMLVASSAYDPCETNLIACRAEARSPEAVACFELALGAREYQALVSGRQSPTEAQAEQAGDCLNRYPPPPADEQGGPPSFVKNLSAQDWQRIIQTLLPPDELKSLVDQALDSIFAVLNGRADSANMDMTNFKRRLTGPAGVEAAMSLLRAQPPCTLEQAARMTISALSLDGDLELCSPSDELAFIIQPLVEINLQLAALGVPDQVTLIPGTFNLAGDGTPLERFRRLRLVLRLGLLIPLVFLLGITAFAVRTPKTWLKWWGWPFLITGLLGALIGFLSAPILNLALTTLLTRMLPAYLPVGIVELGSDLTGAIVRQLLKPMAWESLTLALISGVMLFFAARIDRQETRLAASEAGTEIFNDKPSSNT
jgi:hypothetical protein